MREVEENLCKLVTVTGHTKSGKTVLACKVFPKEKSIWVDGGAVRIEDDFWQSVIAQLDLAQERSVESTSEYGGEVGAKGSAGAGMIVAKGSVEASTKFKGTSTSGTTTKQSLSSRVSALAGLKTAQIPVIVDDFHYLDKEIQGDRYRFCFTICRFSTIHILIR